MDYDKKINPSLADLIGGAEHEIRVISEEKSMENIIDEIDFESVLEQNKTDFQVENFLNQDESKTENDKKNSVKQVDYIKKTRKKKNRIVVYKTRVTVEEAKEIDEKILKSGLRKGEFIRKCLLGKEIYKISDVDEIIGLRNDIARVGGLLKLFLKQNSVNNRVSSADILEVKNVLKELLKLKKKIDKEIISKWQ